MSASKMTPKTCRSCRYFDNHEHPFGATHGRCRWLEKSPSPKLPHWVRFESMAPTVGAGDGGDCDTHEPAA